jgi:signal transduction histidine kinase
MRFYARKITRSQEDERKRIAQELHDDTIQALIAISRRLEALASYSASLSEPAMRSLEQAQDLTRSSIRDLRRFLHNLRPPILDHLGLIAALEGLAGDLMENDSVDAQVEVDGDIVRLVPEVELEVFRIVQEALSNVRRHSGASRVNVRIKFRHGLLRVVVIDDGRGFEPSKRVSDLLAAERLGLIGMYERARTLGGTLSVQSKLGRGTTVTLEVPTQSALRRRE